MAEDVSVANKEGGCGERGDPAADQKNQGVRISVLARHGAHTFFACWPGFSHLPVRPCASLRCFHSLWRIAWSTDRCCIGLHIAKPAMVEDLPQIPVFARLPIS